MILDNIKRLCAEKHISLHSLEIAAGLGNATIAGWETSEPRVGNLVKVAGVLGCTVEDLLKES